MQEELLRNFTERLLKRDAFLWVSASERLREGFATQVFYGHLCVLYVPRLRVAPLQRSCLSLRES